MTNDAQAAALAAALLPHLIESLKTDVIPQLMEEQIGGLKKNTETMLDELKTARAQKDDLSKLLDDHQKQMDLTKVLTDQKKPPAPDASAPVVITREQARDRQVYLAAQADAAKRGVKFHIGAAPATSPSDDTRTHAVVDGRMLVTAAAARDTPLYKKLRAQAERDHLEFAVVRELPDAES
jgi:hypothetical protein